MSWRSEFYYCFLLLAACALPSLPPLDPLPSLLPYCHDLSHACPLILSAFPPAGSCWRCCPAQRWQSAARLCCWPATSRCADVGSGVTDCCVALRASARAPSLRWGCRQGPSFVAAAELGGGCTRHRCCCVPHACAHPPLLLLPPPPCLGVQDAGSRAHTVEFIRKRLEKELDQVGVLHKQ